MSVLDPKSIVKGKLIRFRSLNPHDNVTWQGTVLAVCDYNIACAYADVRTYYQEVMRAGVEQDSKETLTYIILQVLENNNISTKRVFALDWIDPATLEEVELNNYQTLKVYGITLDIATEIQQSLRAQGYVVDIVS